jgi:uncharacterized protein YjbI with pentapeptide repeats
MDKEESLALYAKGKDAWNAWANDMLTKKAVLEKAGQWEIDTDGQGINQKTRDWMDKSTTNFYKHIFSERADFSGFIFPYFGYFDRTEFSANAEFYGVKFIGKTSFHNVKFINSAQFTEAEFCDGIDFSNTEFSGDTRFYKAKFSGATLFHGAKFDNFANFQATKFGDYAKFSKVRFIKDAWFHEAKFSGTTYFYGTEFHRYAAFDNTEFRSNTDFNDTIFVNRATFCKTKFSNHVEFHKAKFSSDAIFDLTSFEGIADFHSICFESNSSFIAMEGKSHFSFRNAKFHVAPDFNQAHFTEVPQFDDVDFSKALNHNQSESEENLSSRWRALKRLAIQGHDHERELLFFAEEIKSQRSIQDKAFPNPVNYFNNKPVWLGGARYWFGYLYEYSSDFGRSVMLPLIWLLVLGFLFQVLYLKYPIDSDLQEAISCDRSEAAIYLSVRSTLPFLPATSYSENLSRSYTCLYGKNSDGKENIPNAIVFISIFQTILSSILIFLLLLALRNHFRIK